MNSYFTFSFNLWSITVFWFDIKNLRNKLKKKLILIYIIKNHIRKIIYKIIILLMF